MMAMALATSSTARAMDGAARDSVPACETLLDGLARKIEADYAGLRLEYRGADRARYERERERLRARARTTTGDDCFFVLRALTDFFHDPHLFVYQRTDLDTAEVRRRAERRDGIAHLDLSEADARAMLARRAGALDPIEGIWRDGALRVAVIPAPGRAASPARFVAVILASDTATWRPGDVRARFARRSDGAYDGELWEGNLARRFPTARVHKRVLLRLSPGMWGKEWPVLPADSGLVSDVDPHRATLVWRGGTPVISIPSHDPTYRGALDSLVAGSHDAIARAERLVIDLRGNEGGSSGMSDTLLPFLGPLASASARPGEHGDDDPQMLSSSDQIAYARALWFNIADSATVARLVERMVAHPGALVPVYDSTARAAASPASSDASRDGPAGPRRIAVLIDGGTVSAAEVFVLRAMRSPRARTFGTPTEGALDYQSVGIVRIGDTAGRWYLGYPTITARPDLPRGGMRGRGIAPQVRVDWTRTADPIGYVIRTLGRTP
jgi:hypothetical protein